MVLTQFQLLADNSSGLGALGFSLSSFLIQLITFILAYLVLRKWAFGPIMKILKERRDVIDKGVKLGEQMEKEKIALEDKIEQQIAEARAKADAILTDANEAAKDAIRKAETDAELKAMAILDEAKDQTKQEIQRAKRKLEAEIVELVGEATEAILNEKVDSKKDTDLIHSVISEGVKS